MLKSLTDLALYQALVARADPPDLAGYVERPAWMRDALCREFPDVTFFPERGEATEPAKAICGRCSVASECLAYALTLGPTLQGTWGGTSGRERRQLRRVAA
jgi:WhiB family redox-sensing transcriptional regulator